MQLQLKDESNLFDAQNYSTILIFVNRLVVEKIWLLQHTFNKVVEAGKGGRWWVVVDFL